MKTMKKTFTSILLLTGIFCFSQQTANPLANTEWKGIASIPTPAEVIFKFNTEDLELLYLGMLVEKMKYSFTEQGSLKLVKILGKSPCNIEDEGLYKFQIANDTLTFTIVNDDCVDRETAFGGNSYKKVLPTAVAK